MHSYAAPQVFTDTMKRPQILILELQVHVSKQADLHAAHVSSEGSLYVLVYTSGYSTSIRQYLGLRIISGLVCNPKGPVQMALVKCLLTEHTLLAS
jgi:hypothetical protein